MPISQILKPLTGEVNNINIKAVARPSEVTILGMCILNLLLVLILYIYDYDITPEIISISICSIHSNDFMHS